MTTLRQWLEAAPFTLTLSSGFFGFYAHAGLLRALEQTRLLPQRITGSSAGSLAGGAWAAGLDADALIAELRSLSREDFWDPGFGPGLLRGELFRQRLERFLPVQTFEGCRVPLAISVFDMTTRRTQVVDSGPLIPAIQASCSVPLMFHPVWVNGHAWVDGGVRDRPALASVAPGERVFYHHITSRLPSSQLQAAFKRDVPRRDGLVSLVCADLPRADPWNLDAGRRAIDIATASMLRALAAPVNALPIVISRRLRDSSTLRTCHQSWRDGLMAST